MAEDEYCVGPTARELFELKNKHPCTDIYVIGSAASMDYIDPEFFKGRLVIGCNTVHHRFPVTYSVFKEGNADQWRAAAACSTLIVSRHPFGYTNREPMYYGADFPAYYVFPHRMNYHTAVDWEVLGTDEIVVSYSTITSAIHIAAYMGAKNVFLCGVDGGRLNGRLNYTDYYTESQVSQHDSWYQGWVRDMLPQTPELRDRLRQVYGCRVYLMRPFLNFQLEGHKFEP